MVIKVSIKGIEETKKIIQEKGRATVEKLNVGIQQATIFLDGEIKTSIARGINAPVAVDTGRFLNSVGYDFPQLLQGVIMANVDYAGFIEYGTSKMAPRPHFRNTLIVNNEKVKQFIGEKLKE